MAQNELVRASIRNGLGILTLDSGGYNTLSSDAIFELGSKFQALGESDEVKVILITGYPKSFFSSGADVKEILSLIKGGDKQAADEAIKKLQAVYLEVDNSRKPTIAAINGYCLGGGLELALACDFRIAVKDATLGLPEVDLGIIPGLGGTQRLPRLIGMKSAARIALGGKKAMVGAATAKELGLIDEIIEGDFIAGVKSFASKVLDGQANPKKDALNESNRLLEGYLSDDAAKAMVADKAESAVKTVLRALSEGVMVSFESGLDLERSLFLEQAFSPDGLEGVTAYVEKRSSKFQKVEGEPTVVEKHEAVADKHAEEYAMLRQAVKEFCEREVRPRIKDMEEQGRVFPDILQKMAETGFFSVSYPEEYGGANLGEKGYCILGEELGRVHFSTAVTVGASIGLSGGAIRLYGTETQKQKYLRGIAEGKMIGAFALTEAEAGSNVASLSSKAEKRGDKWIINGTKVYITNADIADVIIVFATIDKDLGQNGITAFIVEKGFPGFGTGKVEHKMGIKASRTGSLEFNDMEVPEENVLGQVGQGFKVAMNTLNYSRFGLSAGCLGMAKRAFELADAHAMQRSQGGKKLYEFQMIQSYFAHMRAKIFLMESALDSVVNMADRGEDIRLEAAIVKWQVTEMCKEVVDMSLQVHGGIGFMAESEISRLYLDARINPIFEGTNEIQQLLTVKEKARIGSKYMPV